MMNKRGQTGIIGTLFALLMFIIIWALWLGGWVNEWAARHIELNSLTGIEAFLVANLQLWVWIGIILAVLLSAYLGVGD